MNYNLQFFAHWPVTHYVIALVFILSFIFYTKYQFEDERAGWEKSKGKWHPYGAAMRALFVLLIAFITSLQDAFIIGSVFLLLFDVGVNVYALKMPPFYKGSTAKLDKSLGKYKFQAYFIMIAVGIAVRIFTNPIYLLHH